MNQSGEIVTRILATVIGFLVLGGWGLGPLVLLLAGKVRTAPKGSYDEAWDSESFPGAARFLAFIHDPASGWVLAHVSFAAGAVAITLLPAFFWSALVPRDALAVPALLGAAVGGLLGFLAVIYDMYGTPILARIVTTDPDPYHKHAAWLIWRYVEQWRERCFKSLSLGLLGLWLVWLGFAVRSAVSPLGALDHVLSWTSLAGGVVLLFLAVTQVVKTRLFGERGPIGALLMTLTVVVWATTATVWLALWF
jgi:hypothetical protein